MIDINKYPFLLKIAEEQKIALKEYIKQKKLARIKKRIKSRRKRKKYYESLNKLK